MTAWRSLQPRIDSFVLDVRYAIRQCRMQPAFAAVAILALALGTGASTAIFGLADWLLVRPLPAIQHPRDLVVFGFESSSGTPKPLSFADVTFFAQHAPALSDVAAEFRIPSMAVNVNGTSGVQVQASLVTDDYFRLLGVMPAVGRSIDTTDERGESGVIAAVISQRLWKQLFNSDPAALGRAIQVNTLHATVVGIVSDPFLGTDPTTSTDIWLPFDAFNQAGPNASAMYDRKNSVFTEVVGRLRRDSSPGDVRNELFSASALLIAGYPDATKEYRGVSPVVYRHLGPSLATRPALSSSLGLLGGVALLLLLTATFTYANLVLSRAVQRRPVLAISRALGGGQWRLLQRDALFGAALSVPAGAFGVLVGAGISSSLRGMRLLPISATIEQVPVDSRTFLFALVLSVGVGTLVSVLSSLVGDRDGVPDYLRLGTRRGRRPTQVRRVLVALQLSVCLVLLVGALLLLATLRNLRSVNLGFAGRDVTMFLLDPGRVGYTPPQTQVVFQRSIEALRARPEIQAASLASVSPFSGPEFSDWIHKGETSSGDSLKVDDAWVSPGYFGTMGIPLLRGRDFNESEFLVPRGAQDQVAIVSLSLARQLMPGASGDPIGTSFVEATVVDGHFADRVYRVIGVASDTKWNSLTGQQFGPVVYFPIETTSNGNTTTILVRSSLPPAALRPAVERVLSQIAPSAPPKIVATVRERVDRTIAEQRLFATLLALLTGFTIVLAALGVAGLVGYSVVERRHELGVRLALGARPGQLLQLLLGECAALAIAGAVVGTIGAIATSSVLRRLLYGIQPLNPLVYLVAIFLLFLVVLAAGLIPGSQASRVDPIATLKAE